MESLEEITEIIVGELLCLESIPTIDGEIVFNKIYNILLENFGE